MPIYEYECGSCHKVFEITQKFSDAPLETCQECGKGPVSKLISRTSFHLKGSGWYASDYKSSPKPKDSESKPAASESTPPPAKCTSGPCNTAGKTGE